jgi:hypothetical protein
MEEEKHREILPGEKNVGKEETGVVPSDLEVIASVPNVVKKLSISRVSNVRP